MAGDRHDPEFDVFEKCFGGTYIQSYGISKIIMEDLSTMEVGDTVRNIRGDEREFRIVEKELSSVGKINAVIVEPIDDGGDERIRIPQSEWSDTWTA